MFDAFDAIDRPVDPPADGERRRASTSVGAEEASSPQASYGFSTNTVTDCGGSPALKALVAVRLMSA